MRGLRDLSISTRLRMLFGTVIVLMLLGSALSLWQFRFITSQTSSLSRLEYRLSTLLRLDSRLLQMMAQLHRSAEHKNSAEFAADANQLLRSFKRQSAESKSVLQQISLDSERHAALMSGVMSMISSLEERIDSIVQLARVEDWVAVRARLLNQEDQTDKVVTALIGQVDSDMARARAVLVNDLETARSRAFNTLALTAFLTVAAAALLGTYITGSITQPLTMLDRASRALGAGDFHHRVPVSGSDELAHVGRGFNTAAAELARMFEEVQRQRETAETAEAALQEHAQELSRANADLQQFAYSASHDLQEPLRIVALYSQLLQKKYSGQLDDSGDVYIERVLSAALHMQQLISDLLAYTQTTSINKEGEAVSDMNAVLHHALELLDLQIRTEGARIEAESLPVVRAHHIHVQQLLQNLIANALKYRGTSPPKIRIWAERREGMWLIAVQDNGIGIDPQYADRIFGIFKRLHGQAYPGTGIGLAICQRIVERYGGRISVDSRLGEGATFRFSLPAA